MIVCCSVALLSAPSDSHLLAMVLCYFVSIAFYNFCGLAVSKSLSSMHRVLIDACTTALVWIVDTVLFYRFAALPISRPVCECVSQTRIGVRDWALRVYCRTSTRDSTGTSVYGEEWNRWSPLQLLGFAVMFWGTSSYYGVLKYPWFSYPLNLNH